MQNKLLTFLIILLASSNVLKAQEFFPKKNYPSTRFRNPLKIPTSLAGNFGECRPNHFHSGLDVRTEQRENLAIYAIQGGYVSRVSISHRGFGTCLYINHPGGYTSVYAHCNKFFGLLWKYVEEQQYAQKKWDIDIQIPPHLFPVQKGSYVAKSGNTGSSHAPHLHMEIRDTKTDKTLNGLLFYGKMADKKKPIINRLAVYDGNKSIYHQEPKVYRAIKKGNYDVPTSSFIKLNTNKAYFGIQANDYMENSLRLGIFRMKLIVDGEAVFGWQLDNIGYDETRYMNAIGDYKTKMTQGFWLQLCRKLPNDQLDIYVNKNGQSGLVDLSDGAKHNIVIRVYDVKGNSKDVKFVVQGTTGAASPKRNCTNYLQNGKKNVVKTSNIAFELPKEMLYDDLCFKGAITNGEDGRPIYQVHQANVPVHDYFTLRLKPQRVYAEKLKDKMALLYSPNNDMSEAVGMAAALKNGWVEAEVKQFGNYQITVDQSPPAIVTYFKNGTTVRKGTRLKFSADDNLTSVKKIEARLDGQWLRFSRRKNSYYYYVDEHFPAGKHTLEIKAWDENDNMSVKQVSLNR